MNQTEAVNTMKILQKPRQNGEIQYASKKQMTGGMDIG